MRTVGMALCTLDGCPKASTAKVDEEDSEEEDRVYNGGMEKSMDQQMEVSWVIGVPLNHSF